VPDGDNGLGLSSEQDTLGGCFDSFLEANYASQTPQRHSFAHSSRGTQVYTVGVICALHKELKAVRMLFDETHDNPAVPDGDPSYYACGCLAKHNVVAVCLPDGEYGTNAAANVASNVKRSFPQLRLCLLVGIGGPSLASMTSDLVMLLLVHLAVQVLVSYHMILSRHSRTKSSR
jgi:hypothetical protein